MEFSALKILLANISFANYTGTEVVIRDLASAFRSAGHQPIVFSPRLGKIAEELTGMGIQVTDDLSRLSVTPDIIHGQHHRVLVEALLRFPATPAISICHDATNAMDEPYLFQRVRRYLAVDERCRQRVERALGTNVGQIGIVPNAVDLARFQIRDPLPPRPCKALIFSNYARRNTHLKAIRTACRQTGLDLDVIGEGVGTQSTAPERELPRYDLVFAKARCALEALAVGNAVVLCDFGRVGPYVTSGDLDRLRLMNFGQGVLTDPLDPGKIADQIANYDPVDAMTVTRRIRAEAGLDAACANWIRLYTEAIEEFDPRDVNRVTEYREFADYLATWHYIKRVEWEKEQALRLKAIPLVGAQAVQFAHWAYKRWISP
ncbi:glycosyltransferase [Edaphobacter sp. HDX4]|uniref:glycosyltransferase n=1 Tax=Edaphobacter sp. HDX4 TaxID=2794064 RepID=UPI002FE5161E